MSWTRFLGVLLFTILFGVALFLIASALTNSCNGAEIQQFTTNYLPAPYPPEVYNMTDEEFFTWANIQNAKALADWNEWYKTAPSRWVDYNKMEVEGYSAAPRYFSRTKATPYGVETRSISGGVQHQHYTQRNYRQYFLNPGYVSRPLIIINPYCPPRGNTNVDYYDCR